MSTQRWLTLAFDPSSLIVLNTDSKALYCGRMRPPTLRFVNWKDRMAQISWSSRSQGVGAWMGEVPRNNPTKRAPQKDR